MSKATFTLDDLLAAMRGGKPAADLTGFATTQQWAERLGCSIPRMQRLIRDALAKRICEHRRVPMSDLGLFAIDGSNRQTNAYAFRVQPRSRDEGN